MEPLLSVLLAAPLSKADLPVAPVSTRQPSLARQVGAEVCVGCTDTPIHLWVAPTEPGILLLASHAIAGTVFRLNPRSLAGLVNYLILQLLPEGWYEIYQKCSTLSRPACSSPTLKGPPGSVGDKLEEAYWSQ